MKLSPDDFKMLYRDGQLKLAFIGTSNIGKSYTAKRLAQVYDFALIDIDRNIQALLGKDSMEDFAAWQGQPYERGYKQREAESIRLETQATMDAIESAYGNTILDTAGSVIYTSGEALSALKEQFYIVHITANSDDITRLQDIYFEQPKPLIWGDHFVPNSEMTNEECIAACYPALLAARAKLYAELADGALSSEFILKPEVTAKNIFEALSGG